MRGSLLSSLNRAIDALNDAREVSNAAPAKAILSLVSALLAKIRVRAIAPYSNSGDKAPAHDSSGLHGQRTGLR